MKFIKHILILIFILTLPNSTTFGQEKNIDYTFMNSALKQVEKYDSTYFLLQSKSYSLYFNDRDFEYYYKELKPYIKPQIFKEIIKNSHSRIDGDIVLDSKKLDISIGYKFASPSRIDSLQRDEINSNSLNKRIFYICSLPVFSNDKTFAVFDFGGGTKRLAMQGKKYLFKKVKNEWKLIATFGSWSS